MIIRKFDEYVNESLFKVYFINSLVIVDDYIVVITIVF